MRASGEPIAAADFVGFMGEARRSRVSLEFNASYCRGLLETRYGAGDLVQIEPSNAS